MTCKMDVSGAKEVRFNTGLPLLQEEKFNRAQTHRWRSGKYYCWDAIFVGGVKVPITANKHKKTNNLFGNFADNVVYYTVVNY